ncbi:MAG: cytochrome b N-terminal domain-containing protein [Deltaproteobacteria bacterium]|nr:cytochrome b N-terminal domain-containing protein [Deltaproteobacteria bacterium]
MKDLFRAFDDGLDRRVGHRRLIRLALDEPVRGGASFAYVFGSAALILFLVQLGTGLALATVYSASATDAWASIAYLEREIPFGSFVRGLHHHAASAMVVVVVLHLIQTAIYGAYKTPRELNWLSGLLLLAFVLTFALTGYLLPWDQTGYWATKVATSIAGTVPIAGDFLQRVAQGGNDYGTLTLTRFYSLHAIALPLISIGLIIFHVYLFRRHGVTPRASVEDPARNEPSSAPTELIAPTPLHRRTDLFWPRQVFFDALFASGVLALVAVLASRVGAPLLAPADPASTFLARPEWYFLFLFQLLKLFEGPLEVVGTVVIPGAVATFLVALPFLDRAPSRRLTERKTFIGALLGGGVAILALTAAAMVTDRRDPKVAEERALAEREARRAKDLARSGVPVSGATKLAADDPLIRGERLFRSECLSCHSYLGGAAEKPKGPDLSGYGSRAWIRQVLRDPDSPRLFGRAKICGMASLAKLEPKDLSILVELVYGRRDPRAPAVEHSPAAALVETHECEDCHDFERDSPVEGPALGGYGSAAWIRSVIEDPSQEHLYGEAHEMPSYKERLREEDLAAVVAFVASLDQWEARDRWPWTDDPTIAPPRCPDL